MWIVRSRELWANVPLKKGPAAVCHWESNRLSDEVRVAYVRRAADETLQAVQQLPPEEDSIIPKDAEVYYNLTWISEAE